MIITDEMKALVDNELGDIDTGYCHWGEYRDSTIKRIIELHEQSKPKPEPYCYISENTGECVLPHELPEDLKISGRWKPLYTTPPTRELLSGYKLADMWKMSGESFIGFARMVEQAHGIGVTK